MSEHGSETVTVDGHRISYVAAGDPGDPPVVLLHGGIIDAGPLSWGAVLEPLADAGYRAVAPDLLGYGDSATPDGPYTIDRHRAVVEGFVEAVGAERPALVGLSLGGAVALAVHLDGETPIDRLGLVSSYGLGTELPNGRLSYLLARVQILNRIAIALFRRSRRLTRASLGGIVHDLDVLAPEAVDLVHEYARQPNAGVAFRSFPTRSPGTATGPTSRRDSTPSRSRRCSSTAGTTRWCRSSGPNAPPAASPRPT